MTDPFPLTALRHHYPQLVRDCSSSYEIDLVIVIWNFVNSKGHQNRIRSSKVTAILLKGWILPIGGASAVEGLRSTRLPRLVKSAFRKCWRLNRIFNRPGVAGAVLQTAS